MGAQEHAEKQAEMEERKRGMIRQLLEPDALERLHRIGLAKPENQLQIEAMILNAATKGGIQEKISEPALIAMLEQIEGSTKTTSVKIQRKRRDDSDDDIDLDNL